MKIINRDMGLFNLNKNKKKVEQESTPKEEGKKVALLNTISTENMDLSQPFIGDELRAGTNWVYFGGNNLYPNILNQLYLSSPMHSSCVDFKTWSVIGEGYEWEGYDKMDGLEKIKVKTFERTNKFKDSFRKLTRDYIKHGRSIVLLHFNGEDYDKFKVVDPSEIRNSKGGLFTDIQQYFYSDNWLYRTNPRVFKPYRVGSKDEWQIFEIKNEVGSSRTYGLPDWLSSANWQSVSADLGLLHKSALENGIQPSVIFSYPYLMGDEEDENWMANMRNNQKGVKNYNKAMKIEHNGLENSPDIRVLETSDNHKLFEQTSKEQKEEIAISHNINPALMGVRVAGSLGASDEIEFSAMQFEKIWLNDNRNKMEDFLNDILSIFNMTPIEINKTEIKTFGDKKEDI